MEYLQNAIIKLRALEPKDINFLFNTENNINLWEVSNTTKPFSKFILEDYIKNSHKDIFTTKQVRFIIETINEKKVVGMIDLFDYEPIHLRAGVGINIIENEQRNSYAENALIVLKEYCFNILRLNQIYCNISADNKSSIRLFEKVGFKLSGKKEQWLNTSEGFKDILFYQLFL